MLKYKVPKCILNDLLMSLEAILCQHNIVTYRLLYPLYCVIPCMMNLMMNSSISWWQWWWWWWHHAIKHKLNVQRVGYIQREGERERAREWIVFKPLYLCNRKHYFVYYIQYNYCIFGLLPNWQIAFMLTTSNNLRIFLTPFYYVMNFEWYCRVDKWNE